MKVNPIKINSIGRTILSKKPQLKNISFPKKPIQFQTVKKRAAMASIVGLLLAMCATNAYKQREEINDEPIKVENISEKEETTEEKQEVEKEEKIEQKEVKKKKKPYKKAIKYASQFELMNEREVENLSGEELPDGAWCAAFLHNVLLKSCPKALPDWYVNGLYNISSGIYANAIENNALITDINEVKPGDIAIIRRRGSNEATHVALVVSVLDDESVETIEGNTTNPEVSEYCVSKKTRFLKADRYEIMGFARIIQED